MKQMKILKLVTIIGISITSYIGIANPIKPIASEISYQSSIIGFHSTEDDVKFLIPQSMTLASSSLQNSIFVKKNDSKIIISFLLKPKLPLGTEWAVHQRLVDKNIKIFPAPYETLSMHISSNGVNSFPTMNLTKGEISFPENGIYYHTEMTEENYKSFKNFVTELLILRGEMTIAVGLDNTENYVTNIPVELSISKSQLP